MVWNVSSLKASRKCTRMFMDEFAEVVDRLPGAHLGASVGHSLWMGGGGGEDHFHGARLPCY